MKGDVCEIFIKWIKEGSTLLVENYSTEWIWYSIAFITILLPDWIW